jgi:hypothetical protein
MGALAAAAIVAAIAGARNLSMSDGNIRATFREFRSGGSGGSVDIRCPLTLEGSFHSRTYAKVRSTLVGQITRAAMGHPCTGTGGEMYVLNGVEVQEGRAVPNSLPWHLRYFAFSGTLPRLSSVTFDIVGFSWIYPPFGEICLYRSTEANPARFVWNVASEGRVTGIQAESTPPVLLNSGGFLCPREITYANSGTIARLNTSTAITITLI